MKALIATDTHRGFSENTAKIHDKWAERMACEAWDIVILCGDLASNRKEHFRGALKFWRRLAGDRPIVLARGNHDLWHPGQKYLGALRETLHGEWFADYGIHHLESMGPYEAFEGLAIVGWDGWYKERPSTNDLNFMPHFHEGDTWAWLQKNSFEAFSRALGASIAYRAKGWRTAAVTHFPIAGQVMSGFSRFNGDEAYFDALAPSIDYLFFGHSHKRVYESVGGVLVCNTGSDYDKPKHLIVDLLGLP